MKNILNKIHWSITLLLAVAVFTLPVAALSLGMLNPTLNATMVPHHEDIPSNTTQDITVSCPTSYIALSAGYSTNNPDMKILKSQPAPTQQNRPNNNSSGWEFYVSNYSTFAPTAPFDIQVLCVKE